MFEESDQSRFFLIQCLNYMILIAVEYYYYKIYILYLSLSKLIPLINNCNILKESFKIEVKLSTSSLKTYSLLSHDLVSVQTLFY